MDTTTLSDAHLSGFYLFTGPDLADHILAQKPRIGTDDPSVFRKIKDAINARFQRLFLDVLKRHLSESDFTTLCSYITDNDWLGAEHFLKGGVLPNFEELLQSDYSRLYYATLDTWPQSPERLQKIAERGDSRPEPEPYPYHTENRLVHIMECRYPFTLPDLDTALPTS